MILALGWKEMREQSTVWVAVAALGVLFGLALASAAPGAPDPGLDEKALLVLAVAALAATYGLVCGATMLAGEEEAGTLPFLDTLPVPRRRVWAGKLLAGLVLTLLQGLLLGGLGAVLGVRGGQSLGPSWASVFHGWSWLAIVPAVALEAYCWGLLGSALCRHALPAVVLAAVLLALPWVVATPATSQERTPVVLVRAGLALGALLASAAIFARSDVRRTARGETPAVPSAAGRRSSGVIVLLWLAARQGGAWLPALAGGAFLLGLLLVWYGPIYWPVLTLLVGVACGSAVYAEEQRQGTCRFLGDQRLPLTRVWLGKTGFWLAAAVGLAGLVLAGGLLHLAGTAGPHASRVVADRGAWPEGVRWGRLLSPVNVLGLWLLYGFSIAQTCSLVWRKSVAAVFLALALSAGVSSLWLPSLLAGGLPAWQVFVPPALLLLANRLALRAWVSDRLHAGKPLAGLALCGVVCLAWIAGCLGYRTAGVAEPAEPTAGQSFPAAVRKFEERLHEASPSEAGPLIRQAVSRLAEDGARATAAVPPDRKRAAGARPAPERAYDDEIEKVMVQGWWTPFGMGWQEPNPALGAWLDGVFSGGWAGKLRDAATQPPGVVEDPRRADWFRSPDVLMQCQWAATLYTVRALQLQARGQDEAALDHLLVVLALSRQLRHLGNSLSWTAGVSVERTALQGLDHWLERLGPKKELLARALRELTRHEEALPLASDAVLGDYVLLRETLAQPGGLLRWFGCDGPSLPARINGTLLVASWEAPWEKARAERLVRATFAGRLRAVEAGYPALAARRPGGEPYTVGRMALAEWLPARDGPEGATERGRLSELLDHSWLGGVLDRSPNLPLLQQAAALCRVRGLRLVLALALHRLDKGHPAPALDDLVAGGQLRELPRDPFSPTGQAFAYRVSGGEDLLWDAPATGGGHVRHVPAGQGIVWSVGPDLTDDRAHVQGATRSFNRPRLAPRGEDWIFLVPDLR